MDNAKKATSVSVIIPTYNRSGFIAKAIESVLDQTYEDFEIIVVDDCSTDDTEEIVKGFNDNRIRYVKLKANSGAQAARNAGIRSAAGKYISFLDSDDVWLPEKLHVQMKVAAARAEPCIVHGDALIFEEEKNIVYPFNVPKLEGYVYAELLKGPGPIYQCLFAQKECFDRIGILDESVPSYQEWDTFIRLSKYYEFAYVDKPLMVYNMHIQDTISKNKLREARGWEYIVNKYKKDILERSGRKYLSDHYSHIGWLYNNAGDFKKAKKYFLKGFSEDKKNPRRFIEMSLIILGKGVTDICAKHLRVLSRIN